CATIKSSFLAPGGATPSLAAASVAPAPAIAAAAAAPREICSMNVLRERSEWTKHTAHPPRVTEFSMMSTLAIMTLPDVLLSALGLTLSRAPRLSRYRSHLGRQPDAGCP